MLRNLGLVGLVVIVFWGIGYLWLSSEEGTAGAAFQPEGHFRTFNAASITPERAESIYENLRGDMADRYAEAAEASAMNYQKWQRFNSAPYLSATHGDRFVNNFGNALAVGYAGVLRGETMPPGAILAKDAFAVTEGEKVFAQSLFLMEKLEQGRSPAFADWRYVMITAAGELYADSLDPDTVAKVTFCHDCHKDVADQDYLFHVPEPFRVPSR